MQRLWPEEILRGSYYFQVAAGRKNRISRAKTRQTPVCKVGSAAFSCTEARFCSRPYSQDKDLVYHVISTGHFCLFHNRFGLRGPFFVDDLRVVLLLLPCFSLLDEVGNYFNKQEDYLWSLDYS